MGERAAETFALFADEAELIRITAIRCSSKSFQHIDAVEGQSRDWMIIDGSDVSHSSQKPSQSKSRSVSRLVGCAWPSNHICEVFSGTPILAALWRGGSSVSLAYL